VDEPTRFRHTQGQTLVFAGVSVSARDGAARYAGNAALPGPLDVHSASSYQWVARSASATVGSVCFA
jgi:hypothetical protein